MFSTQNRGQVGIGTLIVFIAMVLVAAIAAGVLINTAGLLQAQAQQTGEETTAEVSDGIEPQQGVGRIAKVTTKYSGGVVNSEEFVNEIRISVTPTSGSDPINLTKISVAYEAAGTAKILSHESEADPPTMSGTDITSAGDPAYLVEVVQAEKENNAITTSQSDTYQIVIPLGVGYKEDGTIGFDTSSDNPMDPNAGAEMFPNYAPGDLSTQDPYTLQDVTADPAGGGRDKVSFDNSRLYVLPADETITIRITAASGSTRHIELTTGNDVGGNAQGSIIL